MAKHAKKIRLYVIGPVTGYHNDNKDAFLKARERLEAAGYTVIIPHDVIPTGTPWAIALRISIATMLTKVDAVAKLDGTYHSRGADIEAATAIDCDMAVRLVSDWMRRAKLWPLNHG